MPKNANNIGYINATQNILLQFIFNLYKFNISKQDKNNEISAFDIITKIVFGN